ncbi:MAG TPA: PilZ domain-containing protein [Clostridia bacterium]|nr:PilZ domain-containing protein [Clostridia bacterium]
MSEVDRRKFERVTLPESAKVFAEDERGNSLGPVRILGRGGMLVDTRAALASGSHGAFYIVDDSEAIRREVHAVVRYVVSDGIGLEFEDLDPDAAVEIGVIIGKHYSAAHAR